MMDARRQRGGRPPWIRTGALGLRIALWLGALGAAWALSGCARNSPAEADAPESRLTTDGTAKYAVRFSPDGKWIAYGQAVRGGTGLIGVYVLPRSGGAPKCITPDTLGAYPLEWEKDGSAVFAVGIDGKALYRLGLDGSISLLDRVGPLAHLVDVSSDGRTLLMVKFNRDNRDAAIRTVGGKTEFLAETPEWEEDASFGPGPGEITAAATPSYQAPASILSVWSPATRRFTPLPLPEGQNYQPTWSPDGQLMAYTVSRDGQTSVWVYDARAGSSFPVAEGPSDATFPAWSPNGEWLAYCRTTSTSHLAAGDPRKTQPRELTQGPALDYAPAVSPDGKWIAFLRRPTPAAGAQSHGPNLCVMPTTGGAVKELNVGTLTLPSKAMGLVAWSRDSREIAFHASEGSSKQAIYRIGRDGGGLMRVTLEPGDEVEPHWSPDGRSISYVQVGGGRTQVAIVPANGGLPRIASAEGRPSEQGVWSPTSDRLAYVTYRDDGGFEIWVAPVADPARRRQILASRTVAWPLFWSHDGKALVMARGRGQDWRFTTMPVDGGPETEIGKEVPLPSGRSAIAELNSRGEAYRDLFYPGGVIFADWKATSDLYTVRARDLDRVRVARARGGAGR
jgi:Tol biopolymer transport system component